MKGDNSLLAAVARSTRARVQLRKGFADSARKAFKELSKRPHSRLAASMMLTIMDAWEAPTDAEYHAQIKKLPVTITSVPGTDELGRSGVHKAYSVAGKTKIRTFIVTESSGATSGAAANSDVDAPVLEDGVPGPSFSVVTPPDTAYYCDAYWPDTNEHFTGDCASVLEVDDALAQAAAEEEAVEQMDFDVEYDKTDFCGSYYDDSCLSHDDLTPSSMFPQQVEQGGPSADQPMPSCLTNWGAYAAGLYAFGNRLANVRPELFKAATKAAAIAAAATPEALTAAIAGMAPGAMVFWAISGVVVAGAVVGLAAYGIHSCYSDKRH